MQPFQNETTKKMTKLHNLYVELANSIYDLKTFINTPTEELNKKDEIKELEITISKVEKDLEPDAVRSIKRLSDFVSPSICEF